MLAMTVGRLLEGIRLARIVTVEASPKTYNFDTAEEAKIKPVIEKGVNKVKRNKNTILGRVKTEDLVSGLDIELLNSTLIPEVLALVDGGTYDDIAKKYTAPVIGQAVARKEFNLEIYTANLDGDGDVIDYIKFVFNSCKGAPVEYEFKDGDFFVPSMAISCNPSTGTSPYTWEVAASLPTA